MTARKRPERRRRPRRRPRLPHFAVFSALALVGGLYLLFAQRPEEAVFEDEPGTPRLEVDRGAIDLGDVPVGKWATASFTITNSGDGRLRFREAPWAKAVAGCCPPPVTIGSTVLEPGDETTLSLSFMMTGSMGGPHEFRVYLPTNDTLWGDRTLKVLSNWVR